MTKKSVPSTRKAQQFSSKEIKVLVQQCTHSQQINLIAKKTLISRATLYRWLKRAKQTKNQPFRHYSSGANHFRSFPSYVPKFILTLATHHPNWSVKTLHTNLKPLLNGKKLVSYGYIQKLLEKAKLSLKTQRLHLSRQLKNLSLKKLASQLKSSDFSPISKLLNLRLYSKTTTPPNADLLSTNQASYLSFTNQLWGRNL